MGKKKGRSREVGDRTADQNYQELLNTSIIPEIPLLAVPAFQCPVANVKAAFLDLVTYRLQVFSKDSSQGLGKFLYLEATFHRKTAKETCDRGLHHQGGVAF